MRFNDFTFEISVAPKIQQTFTNHVYCSKLELKMHSSDQLGICYIKNFPI